MLLGGAGGIGKSGFVQHEATTGALGRAYFTPECDPYRSLVWNAEDDEEELWRKQERICHHEQIELAELADNLFLVSRYGHDNTLMAQVHGNLVTTPLMRELREQVSGAFQTTWPSVAASTTRSALVAAWLWN